MLARPEILAPLQTKQQIAAWAGVSPRTVQSWALELDNACPHYKVGRLIRFDVDEVREWLRRRDDAAPVPRTLRVARMQVVR